MNASHIHLMLNHVPVLGTLFGFALLVYGRLRRSEELTKAAWGVLVIAGLLAIPVYISGEPAEEVVEAIPTVSHDIIEEHEEIAAVALTGGLLLAVVALGGLIRYRGGRIVPGWFNGLMLALALVSSALLFWTANVGGQIRHTEIRHGTAPPSGAD